MNCSIQAIIFDLDGVVTDTAEYHFLAWKRLADEEGIRFTREDNEALRGISRRASLEKLLKGRVVTETQAQEMMARKNGYYRAFLASITSEDLLPGVAELLQEIREAGIKTALGSASRNAPDVIGCLGIEDQLDAIVHGGMVNRQKPAPDLFLKAAREVGVLPVNCVVVEDAAAGIRAAHEAGMLAVGIGPKERVGEAEVVLDDLAGVSLADLTYASTYRVAEDCFEADKQHHHETIMTQGNGYLSTRGTLEERFPGDRQATLIHGMWDDVAVSFTELANAPDWSAIEIWADGKRFDMQADEISDYSRYLDLRSGILHRRLIWAPSDGVRIELSFARFASLADEHLMSQQIAIVTLEGEVVIRVRSLLDSHVENDGVLHWDCLSQKSDQNRAELLLQTRATKKRLALSMVTLINGKAEGQGVECPGCPGSEYVTSTESGSRVEVNKYVSIFTSRDSDQPEVDARQHRARAVEKGVAEHVAAQTAAWAQFWSESDVVIRGDDEAQLAVRHGLFQLRIAAPTNDPHVSMGAKTLSGFGYRGHCFWDNEIFVIPFFTYTQPDIAKNMLLYRYNCLPGARRKAEANGFAGAQFPWESAESGDEVTPTWVPHFDDPTQLVRIWTGDIQIHISSDIAYAMYQYWLATGDDEFWRETGIPVLLETAIFWEARVEPEGDSYAIRDVIGPDENHDHVDNNQFTNHMVQWHLRTALSTLAWLSENAPADGESFTKKYDLTLERLDKWKKIIDGLIILYEDATGLIEQYEGFFNLKDVDWNAYAGRTRSMQEIFGIEVCTEYKALKQADVIALLCLLGDQFDKKTWEANWDYYVPITDHEYGSSLGPAMHAWAAARLGKPEQAFEHFMRAARADLRDVRGNAHDGIHAASAGGMWEAIVFGFAGMRITEDELCFDPVLPSHWRELSFQVKYQGDVRRAKFCQ